MRAVVLLLAGVVVWLVSIRMGAHTDDASFQAWWTNMVGLWMIGWYMAACVDGVFRWRKAKHDGGSRGDQGDSTSGE